MKLTVGQQEALEQHADAIAIYINLGDPIPEATILGLVHEVWLSNSAIPAVNERIPRPIHPDKLDDVSIRLQRINGLFKKIWTSQENFSRRTGLAAPSATRVVNIDQEIASSTDDGRYLPVDDDSMRAHLALGSGTGSVRRLLGIRALTKF